MSYIIIITLFLIYVYGITSIWGSINPLAKKTGAGKLKQAVLDWGYKYSIYWTNFIGLWLSGTLQCVPLVVVSPWFLLGGIWMPICYSFSYKYLNNKISKVEVYRMWDFGNYKSNPVQMCSEKIIIENLSEVSWGFIWGCLMLAAVIGG